MKKLFITAAIAIMFGTAAFADEWQKNFARKRM